MASPLVSVSVTAYQHGSFIGQCLDGIVAQETGFPFEVLVGEDGSTDGTREICLDYAKRYPNKIRLFLHDRSNVMYINGRPTGRNNFLNNMSHAEGKYIALCEGDDYWTDPQKLQLQVEVLEQRPEIAGVFHDCIIADERTGRKRPRIGTRAIDRDVDTRSLLIQNNIPTASMCFRNVIDWPAAPSWFNQTIKGDYAVALFVALEGEWTYLDRAMSVYRIHDGGMWSGVTSADRVQENVRFWTTILQEVTFASWGSTIRARRLQEYLRLSCALLRERCFSRAFVALGRGLGPRRKLGPARISWPTLIRRLVRAAIGQD